MLLNLAVCVRNQMQNNSEEFPNICPEALLEITKYLVEGSLPVGRDLNTRLSVHEAGVLPALLRCSMRNK
jgi:hypothetical protein